MQVLGVNYYENRENYFGVNTRLQMTLTGQMTSREGAPVNTGVKFKFEEFGFRLQCTRELADPICKKSIQQI